MTREEFVFRWKHEFGGMLLAPVRGDRPASTSLEIDRLFKKVEGMLGEMFDALQPPLPPPEKPVVTPKDEWSNFLSFEPPMIKVNERMPSYEKLPEPPKAEVRRLIFDHATKRGWTWNKDASAFEKLENGNGKR